MKPKLSRKSIIKISGLLIASIGLVIYGNNCAQANFTPSSVEMKSMSASMEEEDILRNVNNGSNIHGELKLVAQYMPSCSSRNSRIVGATPELLSKDIKSTTDNINTMINEQKLPVNNPDVLKRYTQLVGLLSEARDLLIICYTQQDIDSLKTDIASLSKELREKIDGLSAAHDALKSAHNELVNQVKAQGEQIVGVRLEFLNKLEAYQVVINTKLADSERRLNQSIQIVNSTLKDAIAAQQTVINQHGIRIGALETTVINQAAQMARIEQNIQIQINNLNALAQQTQKDLEDFKDVFKEIRNAGNEAYTGFVQAWDCQEDLVDKNGGAYLNLSGNVSEACIRSKEEVLYQICTQRYPTFCGQCLGKASKDCSAWSNPTTGLSPKEKLEILMNVRQDIAIEYLGRMAALQQTALFGSSLCKQDCLTVDANGNLPASCQQDNWKHCGVQGQLFSLRLNDLQIQRSVASLGTSLSTQISNLDSEFRLEKQFTANRFADLSAQVETRLNALTAEMSAKFNALASALTGKLPQSVSAVFKARLQEVAAKSLAAAKEAEVLRLNLSAPLMKLPGYKDLGQPQVNTIISEDRDAVLRDLTMGTVKLTGENTGAIEALFYLNHDLGIQVALALNPDQNDIPTYDALLAQKVAGVCPATEIKKTPFTSVLGRDSHHILGLAVARLVLMGKAPGTVAGVQTVFKDYQTPIVKAPRLQQSFTAYAFDYRLDVTKTVGESCLSAIDNWALEVLTNNMSATGSKATQQVKVLEALAQNSVRLSIQKFAQISKLAYFNLGSFESTMASRAGVPASDAGYIKAMDEVAFLLVKTAVQKVIADVYQREVDALYLAEKSTSGDPAFELALNTFVQEKIKMTNSIQEFMLQTQADILALKANDAKQAADLQSAIGALQTQMLADKAQSQQSLTQLQQQLDKALKDLSVVQAQTNITPRIAAIRHTFDGVSTCTADQLSVDAMPANSLFSQSAWVCGVNFRSTAANTLTKTWFKLWGAMNKLKVRYPAEATSVEFNLVNSSTNTILTPTTSSLKNSNVVNFRTAQGTMQDGTFLVNIPGLMTNPFASACGSGCTGKIEFTAYGTSTSTAPVTYSMMLYSPLVLNFNKGFDLETVPSITGVDFDLMGLGETQRIGWIRGHSGGFLVLDLNKNGKIDSGKEMFGEATEISKDIKALNGFQALAQYDSNGDGVIDKKDPIFKDLKVWFDLNADGRSGANELVNLEKLKVTSISLNYKDVPKDKQMNNGNKLAYEAKFYGPEKCGTDGCSVIDVFFHSGVLKSSLASVESQ